MPMINIVNEINRIAQGEATDDERNKIIRKLATFDEIKILPDMIYFGSQELQFYFQYVSDEEQHHVFMNTTQILFVLVIMRNNPVKLVLVHPTHLHPKISIEIANQLTITSVIGPIQPNFYSWVQTIVELGELEMEKLSMFPVEMLPLINDSLESGIIKIERGIFNYRKNLDPLTLKIYEDCRPSMPGNPFLRVLLEKIVVLNWTITHNRMPSRGPDFWKSLEKALRAMERVKDVKIRLNISLITTSSELAMKAIERLVDFYTHPELDIPALVDIEIDFRLKIADFVGKMMVWNYLDSEIPVRDGDSIVKANNDRKHKVIVKTTVSNWLKVKVQFVI